MKKKKAKKENKRNVLNALIVLCGLLLSAIAAWPIILNWFQSPKLSVIRQSVNVLDHKIIGEYLVINNGNSTANDIFLQIQASGGDQVMMPFAGKHDIKNQGIDWEINIASLNPGESTGITVFSSNVENFKAWEKEIGRLPEPLNISNIDYREGSRKDVVFDDSPELKEYVNERYSRK